MAVKRVNLFLPLLLDFSGRLLFMHRVLANISMSFFVHCLNLDKEMINKLLS